jgi:hypothetical protein
LSHRGYIVEQFLNQLPFEEIAAIFFWKPSHFFQPFQKVLVLDSGMWYWGLLHSKS